MGVGLASIRSMLMRATLLGGISELSIPQGSRRRWAVRYANTTSMAFSATHMVTISRHNASQNVVTNINDSDSDTSKNNVP